MEGIWVYDRWKETRSIYRMEGYEFRIDGKKRHRDIEWRGYEFRLDAKKQNRYIEWRRYEFRIDGKKQNRYIEWRGYEFRIDGKKRHRYIEWRGYEFRLDAKKQNRYIEWRGYEFRLDGKKRHRYIEWRGYEIDEKKQDGGDTLKIRVESIFSFVIINARKFRGLRCFVRVYVCVWLIYDGVQVDGRVACERKRLDKWMRVLFTVMHELWR